jgi:hypothetical protein
VDRPAIAVGIREEAEAAPRVLLDVRHVDAPVAQEGADFVDVVDVDLDAFERPRLRVDVPVVSAIEQGEPGGMSSTKRCSSSTCTSCSLLKPTWST